jgi:hypothetical protein
MYTTASSFTLRKNAKRAAEAMIRRGTARRSTTALSPVPMGGLRSSGKPPRPRRPPMKSKPRSPRLQRTSLQLRRRLRPRHNPRQRPPSPRRLTLRRGARQRLGPRHSPRQWPPSPPRH